MFDRWSAVMGKKDVTRSRLIFDLVNGLQCKLSTCRRTLNDRPHFDKVFALYSSDYFRPGHANDPLRQKAVLQATVEEYLKIYPRPQDCLPDVVATMSHLHTCYMNALLNTEQARQQIKTHFLRWTDGDVPGLAFQPQSCYIWPEMVVAGCVARSRGNNITNGIHYIVKDFDGERVTLTMHPDYVNDPKAPEVDDDDDDEINPDDKKLGDKNVTLPWTEFVRKLRLTHSLPYVYYQGKTVKSKTLLMNLWSGYFTMRTLIMGLGRITKSGDV
jgi:hypothetical protein